MVVVVDVQVEAKWPIGNAINCNTSHSWSIVQRLYVYTDLSYSVYVTAMFEGVDPKLYTKVMQHIYIIYSHHYEYSY